MKHTAAGGANRRPGRAGSLLSTACRGFPPVENRRARTLILGSMPGQQSLRAGEYYAHPRNDFWPVMEAIYGIRAAWLYSMRTQALCRQGVALWDVVRSCRRPGSSDASIDPRSVAVNDFEAFFDNHPRITRVFFNGMAAERWYRGRVLAVIRATYPDLAYTRLPSTSPAHATLTRAEKIAQWKQRLDPAGLR